MIKTYGKQNLMSKIKHKFTKRVPFTVYRNTNRYGKCIRLSFGLVIGLIIDKILIVISKGISVIIPPFAVMLMKKGFVIKEFRFEKDFGKLNFVINHLVWKD